MCCKQVFSLTVVFGLFHGLLLFPVLLSFLGPEDQKSVSNSSSSTDITNSSITLSDGMENQAYEKEVN